MKRKARARVDLAFGVHLELTDTRGKFRIWRLPGRGAYAPTISQAREYAADYEAGLWSPPRRKAVRK